MIQIDKRIEAVFGNAGMPALLTRSEFGQLAGVSQPTVRQMVSSGDIEIVHGKIPSRDLLKYCMVTNLEEAGETEEAKNHVTDCI